MTSKELPDVDVFYALKTTGNRSFSAIFLVHSRIFLYGHTQQT
jgi:hypothetical protein